MGKCKICNGSEYPPEGYVCMTCYCKEKAERTKKDRDSAAERLLEDVIGELEKMRCYAEARYARGVVDNDRKLAYAYKMREKTCVEIIELIRSRIPTTG